MKGGSDCEKCKKKKIVKKTPVKKKPKKPETKEGQMKRINKISKGVKEYHKCARDVGKCKGLGEGVKGYYKCAKKSNCDGKTRRKLEAIGKKMKSREIDEKVVTIGNFFYSAQNRISNIGFANSYLYNYHNFKESYDKPRIRKTTKAFWKDKMDKEEKKFKTETGSTWWKTNYPNIKITDVGLNKKFNASIRKLEAYLREQGDKTVERNVRTSRINDLVRTATKVKKSTKKITSLTPLQKHHLHYMYPNSSEKDKKLREQAHLRSLNRLRERKTK